MDEFTPEHCEQFDPASQIEHIPFDSDHPCGQPVHVLAKLQLRSTEQVVLLNKEYPAKHYSQTRGS
jgi:hypothetical protein